MKKTAAEMIEFLKTYHKPHDVIWVLWFDKSDADMASSEAEVSDEQYEQIIEHFEGRDETVNQVADDSFAESVHAIMGGEDDGE